MMKALALAFVAGAACFAAPAAAQQNVTVTIENLVEENGIAFAPLRIAFSSGMYDSFNAGEAATPAIISIAEGGSGADWFPAFAAAEPMATLGTVGGLLPPGAMASSNFLVDPSVNPFFTFAAMVVPSNDFFIGNDDPQAYTLFDMGGVLALTEIELTAGDIWNAGSEAFDPSAAAFLAIGNNALRTPENGVVEFNFAELAGFNGLETGAGYIFDSGLTADTPIYRISFAAQGVPEPATWLTMILGFGAIGMVARRRSRKERAAILA